jgi:hypothetical protein
LAISVLPAALRSLAVALSPLVVYRGDEPLARMEWVDMGSLEVGGYTAGQ